MLDGPEKCVLTNTIYAIYSTSGFVASLLGPVVKSRAEEIRDQLLLFCLVIMGSVVLVVALIAGLAILRYNTVRFTAVLHAINHIIFTMY